MNIKLKRNIVKAIGILTTAKDNKWSAKEKNIRMVSALELAKYYISEAKSYFDTIKDDHVTANK